MDLKTLSRNTKLIAEALARVVYNLTEKVRKVFKGFVTRLVIRSLKGWVFDVSEYILKMVTFSILFTAYMDFK